MEQVPYQFLFFIICIGGIAYLLRNNFLGFGGKIFGVYLPRPVIITALCIILGAILWIVINMVLFRFRLIGNNVNAGLV